jgi:hypothetical protein
MEPVGFVAVLLLLLLDQHWFQTMAQQLQVNIIDFELFAKTRAPSQYYSLLSQYY